MSAEMNQEAFIAQVRREWPSATITEEDGSGKTYGPPGSLTAHIGPDMQSDVVGVWDGDWVWIARKQ